MKKRSGNSKRGVSLAYAMVAAMALLILSGALIAAAGRNASLTANSVEGRQAYLTAKSSIEYAKTVLNEKQKTAGLLVKDMEKDELDQSGTADDLQRIEAAMSGFSVYQAGDSAAFSQTETSGSTRTAECAVTRKTVREIQYWTAIRSEGPNNGTYTLTPYVEKKVLENGTAGNPTYYTGTAVSSSTGASEEETTPKLSAVRVQVLFQIKVSASVPYGNGRFHRSLSYETLCTIGSGEDSETKPGQPVEISQPGPTVPDHPDPDFLATGHALGGTDYLNSNGYSFAPEGSSPYPVVIRNEITVSGTSNVLSAPEIYFRKDIVYSEGHNSAELNADFLYFSGNLNCNNSDGQSNLKVYPYSTKSGKPVVLYFENPPEITCNNGQTRKLGKSGYYTVPSGTDLFSSTTVFTPVKDPSVYQSYSNRMDYLRNNLNNIISADGADSNGANWIHDGRFSNGSASTQAGKIVYFYSNDCTNWNNVGTYSAKDILFVWAENGDFVVPGGKNVIWKADYISMDLAGKAVGHDGKIINLSGNTIRAGDQNAHFNLVSVNGKDPVLLQFANKVTIYYYVKNGPNSYIQTSYTLDAGIYQVPSGTDLFTSEAKSNIKNIGGGSSSGGGSGSGSSVTVTIPSYTVEPTGPNSFTGGKYVDG